MVTDFYPPFIGGLERVVADTSHALSARGHEVAVATLWHAGLPESEHDGGVQVHRIVGAAQRLPFLFTQPQQRFHPPLPDPLLARRLDALIRLHQPDVVHGHTWMMFSALGLRRKYGFSTVFSLHDYSLICPKRTLFDHHDQLCVRQLSGRCLGCASRFYGLGKGVLATAGLAASRPSFRHVDAYVANSSFVAQMHAGRALDGARITTVHNFVSDDFRLSPPGARLPNLPERYMLFVGQLSQHKGLQVLLSARQQAHIDMPLVLAGTVQSDTPTEFPPDVLVLRNLSHEDVGRAIDHSAFLVSPALWPEPFGMVVVEAMARGRAVIASRIGGMLDIVEDGHTGLLVEPGNVGELARALRRLAEDRALAARLGGAGAERCRTHFSADVAIERLVAVYQRAMMTRHAARATEHSHHVIA
jgi:glycosyltransferase involved in cell wall biosynthesis